MSPKISIIVPVYKVEKYIHKCVDSILNQTFKEFELILVDDGSPDNCGNICDEYVNKDERVKVIHKENGGLSSARNAGIDIAKGEYIGFVDSDDYIEPDMYEILYKVSKENKCDIVSCSSIIHYPNRKVINGGHGIIIHNKEDAMKTMLEGKLYDEVVWVKLFKKSVIGDIRFPIGRIYEDTAFTYKVIDRARKVGAIGEAKYNYIKHENSIMSNAIKDIKIDAIIAYEEMYKFMEEKYPELCDLVTLKLANNSMTVMNLMIKQDAFKRHKENYFKVAKILNSKFKRTIKLKEYPRNVKLLLIANKINPILYKQIIKLIQR